MADFIALLKARADCFRRPRFVVGNPQGDEPYGYCCTDGTSAMIALHNCTWQDRAVPLRLGPAWGLPRGQKWDLYRWYPRPARLGWADDGTTGMPRVGLRPFEIVLIEAVPAGQPPALPRHFDSEPAHAGFAVRSRAITVDVRLAGDHSAAAAAAARRPAEQKAEPAPATARLPRATQQDAVARLLVRGEVPTFPGSGLLVVTVTMRQHGAAWERRNIGTILTAEGALDGQSAPWQPVLGQKTYPSCWQAWRLRLEPTTASRPFALTVHAPAVADVDVAVQAHLVPD
jgi:hypothetical protein